MGESVENASSTVNVSDGIQLKRANYCLMQRMVIAPGLERSHGSHSLFACGESAPVDAQPAKTRESQRAASRLGR
jgi:hypothetical protein